MKKTMLLSMFAISALVLMGCMHKTPTTDTPAADQPAAEMKLPAKANLYYVELGEGDEETSGDVANDKDDANSDEETIGCGDTLVPVSTMITNGTTTRDALLADLYSQAFKAKGLTNDLMSALGTGLSIGSVTVIDGTATIGLKGTLTIGGTCDAPRIQAQLENIAKQFPQLTTINITINGKALADYLSTK